MSKIYMWIVFGVIAVAGLGIFIFNTDSITFVSEKTGESTTASIRDNSSHTEFRISFRETSDTVGKLNMRGAGTTTISMRAGNVVSQYDWTLNGTPNIWSLYSIDESVVVCNFLNTPTVWECRDITNKGGVGMNVAAMKQVLPGDSYATMVWANPTEKRTIIGQEVACASIPQETSPDISGTYYMCVTTDGLQLYAKTETETPVGTVTRTWEALSYSATTDNAVFTLPATPITD